MSTETIVESNPDHFPNLQIWIDDNGLVFVQYGYLNFGMDARDFIRFAEAVNTVRDYVVRRFSQPDVEEIEELVEDVSSDDFNKTNFTKRDGDDS